MACKDTFDYCTKCAGTGCTRCWFFFTSSSDEENLGCRFNFEALAFIFVTIVLLVVGIVGTTMWRKRSIVEKSMSKTAPMP